MENFTNNPVAFDTLPKFETVQYQPLPKEYLNVVYISNSITAFVSAIGLVFLLLFNDFASQYAFLFLMGWLLLVVLLFFLSTVAFRKKGYALREKDILFRSGVIATTTTIIPFNRIQHVALHEGILLRMYGLSELQIYTAGGSSSDLHISGLPKTQAESIKTFLMGIIVLETGSTPLTVNPVTEVETLSEPSASETFTDKPKKSQS